MTKIAIYAIAAVVVVCSILAWYNDKLSQARHEGETLVIDKVQQETIRATTEAQKTKDKANADTLATPYGNRVDGLP